MKRILSVLVLNIGFYTLFFAGSFVAISLLTLAMALQVPFMSQRSTMRRFRNYIKLYGRTVMFFAYPFVRIVVENHADKVPNPCIYICNHRSASDPFLMAHLPGEFVQVVDTWPFQLPVLGRFARWAGYLDIKAMAPEAFFEKGGELLARGTSLVVFPEGTRSTSRTMGPFHGAAFRLALRSGAPLVPVCLTGNENIPRKGSLKLSPGLIRIRLLPPLPQVEFGDMGSFALKKQVHGIISAEVAKMEAGA